MKWLILVSLAACGANRAGSPVNDANGGDSYPVTDANIFGCSLRVDFNPTSPYADPQATIIAKVTAIDPPQGVLTYSWTLRNTHGGVGFTTSFDTTQITFVAKDPDTYYAEPTDSLGACLSPAPPGAPVLVVNPNGNLVDYRMRIFPPPSAAPPQDFLVPIIGTGIGGTKALDVALQPALPTNLSVKNGAAGVPAYVRISPSGVPVTYYETFTPLTGAFSTQLVGQSFDVLVVPEVANLAPRSFTWLNGQATTFAMTPGIVVSGSVKDPAGAALAGAKVQLESAGVPSTLATTDPSGNFSVNTYFAPTAQVTATVTPPPGRGLPHLAATAAFTISSTVAMQIRYASTLATCDLQGTPVQRTAAALPGAQVTIVGPLSASAGTVTTGGVSANASGSVVIAATANATGKLPSTLVPRASLSAVVEQAPYVGLAQINTTTCPAQTIDTPAMQSKTSTVVDAGGQIRGGVQVEAAPAGAWALAGLPPVQTTSDGSGQFSLTLAPNATYDVRWVDPSGHGAPLTKLGTTLAGVTTTTTLPMAIALDGTVTSAMSNPVAGALVQVLCYACTGVDATRPIAALVTDAAGRYAVAVPDPGTM